MSQQQKSFELLEAALGPLPISRIETHISVVVMAGSTVFKLKRALKLPYADFSTPERRLASCEEELRLNSRIAAPVYVRVRRITRTASGGLEFDGSGELEDSVVEMRRFHQRDLFDRIAANNRLTPDLIRLTASRIARFHLALPSEADCDGAESIAYAMGINRKMLQGSGLFPGDKTRELITKFDSAFERARPILSSRAQAGMVRRGHGDLHLGNICLFEGAPTPFDCLEFSPKLATTDVLYDLAFLLMDLWERGRPDLANAAFNRYLDETGDIEHLGLTRFFMAVRAAVRAHVVAAQALQDATPQPLKEDAAQRYFALAELLLNDSPKRLVAVGGFSGSGKSSLAAHIAHGIGAPPGARIVSTDRVRKGLFGVSPMTRLPPEAYTQEIAVRVYASQRETAGRIFQGGHSAIADGVFLKQEERSAIAKTALDAGARFNGLWLTAPRATLIRRIEQRVGDPSDATADVIALQESHAPATTGWAEVNTDRSLPDIISAARKGLES